MFKTSVKILSLSHKFCPNWFRNIATVIFQSTVKFQLLGPPTILTSFTFIQLLQKLKDNQEGYTATLVVCGWAGAGLEKVARASGQELYAQKAKQVAQGQYVVSDTRCPALSDCDADLRLERAGLTFERSED